MILIYDMKFKLLIVVLAISVFLNIFLFLKSTSYSKKESGGTSVELQKKYPLLAKRIFNENFNDILLNFLELRSDLRAATKPWGDNFSLYFEYLPTGTSININGTKEFYQASLFKLPVTMAYYHQLERLKEREDKTVEIREIDIDKEFGDLWKKGVGYRLKMSEAIRLALTESDNTAIKLVVPRITEDDFNAVYEALDIDLHADGSGSVITTKGYSSILKALYFSSVLEEEDSQHILDLLTKTKFVDKLPAGVPHDVLVAHKIGVFNKEEGDGEAFMDCGIVYVPNRPYSLCMYSQSDEQTARERMKKISRIVYDYVSAVNK